MEDPMKKLIATLGILLAAVCFLNGELVVSIGGGYAGAVSLTDYDNAFNAKPFSGFLNIDYRNAGIFESKGGLAVNASIASFFSYTFGVGVSVGYMKSTVDLDSSFNTTMTWYDGEVWRDNKSWLDEGSVTVIPISLDLIYRTTLGETLRLNLSAGPTVYLTTVELAGNAGEPAWLASDGFWYADWYDLNMTSDFSKTVFGGRVAIDIEISLSEGMAFFIGGSYYLAGKIDADWLPREGEVTGEWGELKRTVTIDNTDLMIVTEINISTFVIGGGIRVYL
jgi:hypothetical protein